MLKRLLKSLLLCVFVVLVGVVLLVLALRWVPPPASAFMLEARTQALWAPGPAYCTEYVWRDLEQISPQAAIAVIASEDQQFPFHMGFDFKSIRDAVRSNARGHRQRGASTISQQVAKNLFLWSGGGYFRKGLEASFTLLIETLWPKERILEVYLNIAQFGRGVYGVEAAAQHFWHKPASRLNRADSALLAAVLPNPLRLHVDAPSNYVLQRQSEILDQIAGLGGTAYLDELEKPAAHR